MIDIFKQKLQKHTQNPDTQYHFLRELLQLLVLRKIDEAGYFQHMAFLGGTALRILYDLPRFSEDLDFSLVGGGHFDFNKFVNKMRYALECEGLICEIKARASSNVYSAQFKFQELLHALGLSPHRDAVLMIKFEIDTNPPEGYQTELSMSTKEYLMAIHHYDLPSLYAGKLHALLERRYTKGRDYFDFIWYQGRNIEPNYLMLGHALEQTRGLVGEVDADILTGYLKTRFSETDYDYVKQDIEPFLEDPNDIRFFEKQFFLQLLK